jgi:mono/diheme cytochrome c family protein
LSARFATGFIAFIIFISTAVAARAAAAPPGFKLNGDARRGQAIYAKACALCHGEKGDGRGRLSAGLDPKPKDFTAPGLLSHRSDWEIYVATRDGGQAIGLSPRMPGWSKAYPDQDLRDVAAFVRSLEPAKSPN